MKLVLLAVLAFCLSCVSHTRAVEAETSPSLTTPGRAATVTVKATGLSNANGKVVFLLYTRPEDFITNLEGADQRKAVSIDNGSASAVFENVSPGVYAIAVFHDENDNGTVDYNFLGIPKETTGASRDPRPKLRAPRFDEAAFTVSDPTQAVAIRMNSTYD
ncbi:MAG: DUF2141 domain-containing protein [Deltaproteobacteria bacterium]|nr:DUF2141 domain-containing protein [Deltaproteobacteria bacterium]